MLRSSHPQATSPSYKHVDYFRPLSVDVSVEYELPKEVAPPPGSAPLLIIHPSAYYAGRKSQPSSSSVSILSPSQSRSNSNSSYYLRSATTNNGVGHSTHAQNIYTSQARRANFTNSSAAAAAITRSRSMIGARPAVQGQACKDPSCNECLLPSSNNSNTSLNSKTYYQQQATATATMMELDPSTTPTKAGGAAAKSASKRLRMSQQKPIQPQQIQQQPQQQYSNVLEPLNLALSTMPSMVMSPVAASLYLGASLSYQQRGLPQPPANPGIFQMINNVYHQQQVQQQQQQIQASHSQGTQTHGNASISGSNQRLIFKEGPKGSEGSDSGVCSENESDVSPTNNNNNNSSHNSSGYHRRNIFGSQQESGSNCYCCCCPNTSGSGSGSESTRHNHPATRTNSSSSTATTRSSKSLSISKGISRGNSSIKASRSYQGAQGSSSLYSSMSMQLDGPSLQDPIIPMDASENSPMDVGGLQNLSYRKWFVPPTSADFGRWFQV